MTKGETVQPFLNDNELAAIREALAKVSQSPERDRAIVELLFQGLRYGELRNARLVRRRNGPDGTPELYLCVGVHPKANRKQASALHLAGSAALAVERLLWARAALKGPLALPGALFPASGPFALAPVDSFRRVLAQAAGVAGVPGPVHPSSLRRGFVTHSLRRGASLADIARVTCHGSARPHRQPGEGGAEGR